MAQNITVGFGLNPAGTGVWIVNPDVDRILLAPGNTINWNLIPLGDYSTNGTPPSMVGSLVFTSVTFTSSFWPADLQPAISNNDPWQFVLTVPTTGIPPGDYSYTITVSYNTTTYIRDPEVRNL